METKPLKTFIIYARKDAALKDELLRHLQLLVRKNLIVQWNDADLLPGEEWESRILRELDASDLVLLLVSADAMHSEFIRKKELQIALEKKRVGKTRIVPILVRDYAWEEEEDLAGLQILPRNAGHDNRIYPVKSWSDKDAAWTSICRDLIRLVKGLQGIGIEKTIVEPEEINLSVIPKNGQVLRDLQDMPEMVFVEGGTFQMGSEDGESDERPVHTVQVPSFWIGKYTVTFDEYDRFCTATGRTKPADEGWGRGLRPIINVSWEDAAQYCEWLHDQTDHRYRLPSEAEWEFAARGGIVSKGYRFAGKNDPYRVGWFAEHNKDSTQPVGGKEANELDLYDMSGNIWEWCADRWHDSYNGAPNEGSAWLTGTEKYRLLRGGSWNSGTSYGRTTLRSWSKPDLRFNDIGFRLTRHL